MPSAKFSESMSSSVDGRKHEVRDQEQDREAATPRAAVERLSHLTKDQTFVQAPGAIALRIDRHRSVPGGLQLSDDRVVHAGLERARQILARHFHASERVVMTHAAHAEAERVQCLFAALDLPQLLGRDFVSDTEYATTGTPRRARPTPAARRGASARGSALWSARPHPAGSCTPNSFAATRPGR